MRSCWMESRKLITCIVKNSQILIFLIDIILEYKFNNHKIIINLKINRNDFEWKIKSNHLSWNLNIIYHLWKFFLCNEKNFNCKILYKNSTCCELCDWNINREKNWQQKISKICSI